MNRLTQLRGDAGGSRDSSADGSSLAGESFMTANESSSKYYSLGESESSFDISPINDVSLASAADPEKTLTAADELMPNLSPIPKKNDILDSYKIGKQIEAANILSGGVEIFDDNENSYDGDGLVIDDEVVELDEKGNSDLKLAENTELPFHKDETPEGALVENTPIPSKDTEVVLQIDGKNVNAIDIGNGLYLYRKEGGEELAAVQIIDDDQHQPNFKFLKVRENAEGNLEVYEEIEIQVPEEVPTKEGKPAEKKTAQVPVKDINKVISDTNIKKPEIQKTPQKETPSTSKIEVSEPKEAVSDSKTEINVNGRTMKFNETRKSPFIHSTPNKEGIPLTKTMVDLQLHPNRHLDKVKTIEVHTDSGKQRVSDTPPKKEIVDDKLTESLQIEEADKLVGHESAEGSNKHEKLSKDLIKSEKVTPFELEKVEINEVSTEAKPLQFSHIDKKSELKTEDKNEKTVSKIDSNIDKQMDSKAKEKTISEVSKIETTANSTVEEKLNEITKKSLLKVLEPETEPVQSKSELKEEDTKDSESKANEIVLVKSIEKSDKKENIVESVISKATAVEVSNSDKISDIVQSPEVDGVKEMKQNETKIPDKPKLAVNELKSEVKSSSNVITVDNPIPIIDSKKQEGSAQKVKDPKSENKNTINPVQEKVQLGSQNKTSAKNENAKLEMTMNIVAPEKMNSKLPNKIIIEKDTKSTPSPVVLPETKPDETIAMVVTKIEPPKIDQPKSSIRVTAKVRDLQDKKLNENVTAKPPNVFRGHVETLANLQKKDSKILIIDSKPIEKPNEGTHVTVAKHTFGFTPNPKLEPTSIKLVNSTQSVPTNLETLKSKYTVEATQRNFKNAQSIPLNFGPIKPDKTVAESAPKVYRPIQNKPELKKEIAKPVASVAIMDQKPINNNHAAVPFGQWTQAHRQDFLNKIKETKVPTATCNTKPIKQANDLNRRDVLQKIDSQRQSNNAIVKAQESIAARKAVLEKEKADANKPTVSQVKVTPKIEAPLVIQPKPVDKKVITTEISNKGPRDLPNTIFSHSPVVVKELQIKEIHNQDLINRTIEGMIKPNEVMRPKDQSSKHTISNKQMEQIEMKMNELHGVKFIERPSSELPKVYNSDMKTYSKQEAPKTMSNKVKIPNLLPYANKGQVKPTKENIVEIDSEDELIEHEPVTGDVDVSKKNAPKVSANPTNVQSQTTTDSSKKDPIITENEFDKFARRNSITYENCLTINYDSQQPQNLAQPKGKEHPIKKYSRNEMLLADAKAKSLSKHSTFHPQANKFQMTSKVMSIADDAYNKSYQSKVQQAYQTTMTAKRQKESPITIIEDQPVKVVFMDSNHDFVTGHLNVQGKDLSPAKKSTSHAIQTNSPSKKLMKEAISSPSKTTLPESNIVNSNTGDSMDSDILDIIESGKLDDSKSKSKHQRKQVLTPVEAPELELIEPRDLLDVLESPKKKRKVEEPKVEKSPKSVVPKKSYLLGRTAAAEKPSPIAQNVTSSPPKESAPEQIVLSTAASAIDNLVKAAELLETQAEKMNTSLASSNTESPQSTPVKRGRGRPRKNPLPDDQPQDRNTPDKTKTTTPKKPRLIDAKKWKKVSDTEDSSTDEDDEMIQENWTMGKINENIVCPICNKLFRSENVVFKHVKHCTGPSPNRSDSDKGSSRRTRLSQESQSVDSKSEDDEPEPPKKETPKKRKSKDSEVAVSADKDDVIVIEDSPAPEKVEKREPRQHESRKTTVKSKLPELVTNLECEICGKKFRQLSYLVNHKLQHKKEEKVTNQPDTDAQTAKSVFSCEVCKKEFRKLHHLVQHRIIHNPAPTRLSRKSSSEQNKEKANKEELKLPDDQSAAFRCEPCDKSFRKLYHLVEHRETHDGINRQKLNPIASTAAEEKPKPTPPPQCDICKKTFRKLHHLISHKEQHLETCSEKSDDKSVQSSLSARDIIHECSLCYMVFPNEHSLTKHFGNCQRKKKQSANKQKPTEEGAEDSADDSQPEDNQQDSNELPKEQELPKIADTPKEDQPKPEPLAAPAEKIEKTEKVTEKRQSKDKPDVKPAVAAEPKPPQKRASVEANANTVKETLKLLKIEEKPKEEAKVLQTPKRKASVKDKVPLTVSKRRKSSEFPLPIVGDATVVEVESSDDEDVRYMLNPDYVPKSVLEEKHFMKVRAQKRSSLQIERPNSKDLVQRRTSLQHPPKISRLKPKSIENRTPSATKTPVTKTKPKPEPSTDSDDSDVKYSFPVDKTEPEEVKPKEAVKTPKAKPAPKTPKEKRKSLADKRKSLTAIAKRKSMAKSVVNKPVPATVVKQVKRRTVEAGHRCDCGQLFGSAALLARHASLAHTPPRRRRDLPPPPPPPTTLGKPRKSTDKPKPTDSRKSSVKSDVDTKKRKSTKSEVKVKAEAKTPQRKKLIEKTETVKKSGKVKRAAAHRGVPVPEKMRKMMEEARK